MSKYIINVNSEEVQPLEQPVSFNDVCDEVQSGISKLIPDSSDIRRQLVDAMCKVGQLDVESICNDESVKAVASLAEAAKALSSGYKMVNDMFGFIGEFSLGNSWEIFLKDMLKQGRTKAKAFLYFAGDLKIKSVVYVLRIRHFIAHFDEFFNKMITLSDLTSGVSEADVNELYRFYTTEDGSISERGFTLGRLCDIIKELPPEDRENVQSGIISREIGEKYEELAALSRLSDSRENQEFIKTLMTYVTFLLASNEEEAKESAEELYNMEQQVLSGDEVRIMQSPDSEQKNWKSGGWMSGYPFLDRQETEKGTKTDLLYYLFMNNANEVIFTGVEHNWFWRYRRDKQTLFRCCGTNRYTYQIGSYEYDGNNGTDYFHNLLENTVVHMGKMSKNASFKTKLASYSKFPLYDISTYVRFDQPEGGEYQFNYHEEDPSQNRISFANSEIDNGTLIFAMVKNAETNIVKPLIEAVQNEDFRIGPDDSEKKNAYKCAAGEMTPFSVMIQNKCGKKGSYGFCLDVMSGYTDIDVDKRHVFNKYLAAMVSDDVKKLGHIPTKKVGEVVMLGNTCDAVCRYDGSEELNFDSARDNVEYQVELSRWDVIALFCCISFMNFNNFDYEKISSRIINRISVQEEKGHIVISAGSSAPTIGINGLSDSQKELIHNQKSTSGSTRDNDNSDKEQCDKLSKDIKETFTAFLLEKIRDRSNEPATKRKIDLIMSFINSVKSKGEISSKPYKQEKGDNSHDKPSDKLVDFFRALFLN